jgi:hypothetical protein
MKMMFKRPSDRKLEAFKLFPYIAGLLIIGFSLFVYKLTTELDDNATKLEIQSDSLESKVNVKNKDLINQNFEQ